MMDYTGFIFTFLSTAYIDAIITQLIQCGNNDDTHRFEICTM